MKKIFLGLAVSAYLLVGCGETDTKNKPDTEQHGHDGHSHEHDDHDHAGHEHDHDDHHHDEELADDEVDFTDEQAERVNLTLEKVAPGAFYQVVKTSGQLIAPVGDESTVVASSSGIISFAKSGLNPGNSIANGQHIATVSAKNIAEGDPLAKLRLEYEAAKKEFERAELLAKDSLISMIDYNQAKLNYENARVAHSALAHQSTQNGVSMRSNTQGYIKNILVSDGEYVSVGQPIMTITKNKKIQLKADLSEQHAGLLSQITSANFQTAQSATTYSMNELDGRLVSYGKQLDGSSFYIPVIFEFNNAGNFYAGSFVTVFLKTRPLENAITVPLSAIVEEQGLYFVYVKDREHIYKKKEIKKGADDGKRALVLSGLEIGEELVATSAYHLKLASMSSDIPHGHSH